MLGRWGLFVFWCLVLWGTLIDLMVLRLLLFEGPTGAATALRIPKGDPATAWLNRLCGLLAVLGWLLVAARLRASRAPRA